MSLDSLAKPEDGASGRLIDSPRELRGRLREYALLGGVIEDVRGGRGAALVVRGEAGVGKTALLNHAVRSAARDFRVVRAAGVQSEIELGFAALHQLCGPFLPHVDRLPAPQREALETVFGLRTGPAPDRLLVGLAVLGLLSRAAGECPLACVVDDAQWLDEASAQSLAFAARRLRTEPVLMVFVAREPGPEFHGLPVFVVGGLRDADARQLLSSLVRWPMDGQVRERFLAEVRGNPRALLELSRGLTAELASGYQTLDVPPPSSQIERSFHRRVECLPAQTRRLLLTAAADPAGDPALVWRAATRLGIPADAAMPAAEAGLLTFGTQVRFRHPSVRSAAYRTAPLRDRQEAHRALAEATDQRTAPDRRAWHRAQATAMPHEDVAAELEHSAGWAQARGGLAAAGALLERAATLTPDPARRVERALAAAQSKILAGAYAPASELLAMAEADSADQLQRARVSQLRARLAFASNRGGDAPLVLLRAARKFEPSDADLARATYLDALTAALIAGRLARAGGSAPEVSQAARDVLRTSRPSAPDLLLDGLATHFTQGYEVGAPILRRALNVFGHGMSTDEELRRLWQACVTALHLWDDCAWDRLTRRYVGLARDTGAFSELPSALGMRSCALLVAGDLNAAAALSEEEQAETETAGSNVAPFGALCLSAIRGREDETFALINTVAEQAAVDGEGIGITLTEWAEAVLCNGLGSYDRALAAAERGISYPHDIGISSWLRVELVEAAARIGVPERATSALRHLAEAARASGTDWALGIEARSRALLSKGDAAEPFYQEAVERLGRTRVRVEQARARLLYGEWLRRENRRMDAREQLRTAYEMMTAMGMEGFAERARRELLATGETVRKRTVDTANRLTAQEGQIARLACDGLSNPEISVQLFISPRTVEWHLSKVFTKLGITSRRQLRFALNTPERAGQATGQDLRPAGPTRPRSAAESISRPVQTHRE
ncbi:AAA family ATPase [Streptomyces sp. NPDC054770]